MSSIASRERAYIHPIIRVRILTIEIGHDKQLFRLFLSCPFFIASFLPKKQKGFLCLGVGFAL
jgi:hypothetical protein